tara:strand:- start:741 stop:1142 length:402 start_codon:yes stop_codon:yes gene_type:complete
MDNISNEKRSYNMSRIKSKNTSPEMIVRKFLFSHGFRYRLHVSSLPGTPDIVIRSRNKIINVNGCFWHMHSCKAGSYLPKTNSDFWKNKLESNKFRDYKNIKKLKSENWDLLVIWECEVKSSQFKNIIMNFLS